MGSNATNQPTVYVVDGVNARKKTFFNGMNAYVVYVFCAIDVTVV